MNRYELLETLVPVLKDALVVCNIGIPSQELHEIVDRDNHFYMLGSMGLCSSIGLGLALTTSKPVVALEGDGSVLMNLGTLATIGNRAPDNLILLIIDNGSYGSTGDQASYTSGKTSLADMARGAGCQTVLECPGEETAGVLSDCLAEGNMAVIVSRVTAGNRPSPVVPLHPIVLRERFKRLIRE